MNPDDVLEGTKMLKERVERYNGKLRQFHDGHIPEMFREASSSKPSELIYYPKQSVRKSFLKIHRNALPTNLTHAIYQSTITEVDTSASSKTLSSPPSEEPWGTYVTFQEARKHLEQCRYHHVCQQQSKDYIAGDERCCIAVTGMIKKANKKDKEVEAYRKELAIAAIAHFLLERLDQHPLPLCYTTNNNDKKDSDNHDDNEELEKKPFLTSEKEILSQPSTSTFDNLEEGAEEGSIPLRPHGVGVWVLSSGYKTHVPYHVDYAEWIRYRHNVVALPLYAGTVQCTEAHVIGGEFAAQLWDNTDGSMDPYLNVGYKGRKIGAHMGGWTPPIALSKTGSCRIQSEREDLKRKDTAQPASTAMDGEKEDLMAYPDENGWVTIPYRFNQGILHSGHSPHLSGVMEGCKSDGGEDLETKRVILGLNVFGTDVGEMVRSVPEHSRVFRAKVTEAKNARRKIRYYGGNSLHSFKAIAGNSKLRRALVLAKREKVKKDWQKCQSMMTQWIIERLLQCHNCKKVGDSGVSLTQLVADWEKHVNKDWKIETFTSPTAHDFIVHMKRLIIGEYVYKNTLQILPCDAKLQIGTINNQNSSNTSILPSSFLDENGLITLETKMILKNISLDTSLK